MDKTLTDEELMLAFKAGQRTAFNSLFSRYQRSIYDFLYRFLRQKESVEEAFQEVFIRVLHSAPHYLPTAKFSTWLYTIARNYCIDQSRKGKWRQTIPLDKKNSQEEGPTLEERLADPSPNPHEEVSTFDLAQKLEACLTQINQDQKEVFLMRERLGLSFDEIAEIIGVSVNTVKSRMRYAVVALREELEKLGITDLK